MVVRISGGEENVKLSTQDSTVAMLPWAHRGECHKEWILLLSWMLDGPSAISDPIPMARAERHRVQSIAKLGEPALDLRTVHEQRTAAQYEYGLNTRGGSHQSNNTGLLNNTPLSLRIGQ